MVTTELGACEWFVWDLRRSNLIDRGQLDQIIGEFLQKPPRRTAGAGRVPRRPKDILTDFQAERLLQGKTQGFVLGPFTLMDALGAGSMGTVYKAQSKTDNQWYAVKVLPRRSMWNVRIARRKVRAFEQCKHPSVVPFVDVGTAGGMHYLAWPFVEGETLDKIVAREGKLHAGPGGPIRPADRRGAGRLPSARPVPRPAQAVEPDDRRRRAGAHPRFRHRLPAGRDRRRIAGRHHVHGQLGDQRPGLRQPRKHHGPDQPDAGRRSVQPGLRAVLLLTGPFPFPDGTAVEKMMAHQFKQPTPITELNPEAPPELSAVVSRLMKKLPGERYGSVTEVQVALQPLAQASAFAPRPQPRSLPGREATAKATPPTAPEGLRSLSKSHPPTPAPKASVSVSTPTPKPQALGSLPTRSSLKGASPPPSPAPPKQQPKPVPVEVIDAVEVVDDEAEHVVPGAVENGEVPQTWEERLGPAGISIVAVIACGLVYIVAAYFLLF